MADQVTIISCPLPDCNWQKTAEQPGEAERNEALADVFGFGVLGAVATVQRLQREETAVRTHLETHSLIEWVRALHEAQGDVQRSEDCKTELGRRIAALERNAAQAAAARDKLARALGYHPAGQQLPGLVDEAVRRLQPKGS